MVAMTGWCVVAAVPQIDEKVIFLHQILSEFSKDDGEFNGCVSKN